MSADGTDQGGGTVPRPHGDEELGRLFPGESELARRMRSFDWSDSDLGPPGRWPENLRTAVSLCLTSRFPILIWWGPDLNVLYNDAYIPFLGRAKHPSSLGRPGREVWAEIWDTIGPMLEGVRRTGAATWSDDFLFFFERDLPREEVHVRFTYGPILAADGRTVEGVFCPCTEITDEVVGARRLETLRQLGVKSPESRSVRAACAEAARVLSGDPHDIPFAAIYVVDEAGDGASLVASAGLPEDHPLPPSASLAAGDATPWPLAAVLRSGRAEEVRDLRRLAGPLPGSPWPEPPSRAVVLPVPAPNHGGLAGLLALGVSPRRVWDAPYRAFFDLVAGHIGTALADAGAHEAERRRADALAEIDRAKTAFFSNVSHEFRTPLTLMLGPVEDALADADEPLPPGQRERLETAHRSGLRLLKLVNTLLDFSRIEAGRARASYEPTDLAALTAELASNFRSACEKAGLRLVVDCPPLPEPVFVDRDMWEKVVLNLVSNAFKFTLEGEVVVRLGPVGGAVELSVRDTGTGIPAGELPRIFERFHRVDGARGRTHEGTGIGLALVQELVRLHGGSVRAESTLGRGSTFVVSVPLGNAHLPADSVGASRPPAATAVGAAAFVEEALRWLPDEEASRASPTAHSAPKSSGLDPASEGGDSRRPRILWADDNADMRDYVRRLLEPRYDVEAVPDGEAALAAARASPPDLVLSDVMLPRRDGFGLLGALRADPRTATIPVILLSARAGEESRVEGLEAGADDYLVKPFGARELLARVHAHLEMDRLRREASRREQALLEGTRAAKERLEAVLRSISDGFIALDRDWRYVSVNDRACESMGMRREEILGRRIWDLYPDTVGTRFEAELRRAAAGRETRVFEYYYPERDRWYENRAYPSEDGLSIFFAEITERRRAEAERERLALLVENSNDFIGICDLRGFPTFANPAALRMVGLDSLEQVRGSAIEAFFFPEDRAFVMDDLVPRIIREGQAKAEIRFRHFVTGEPIWTLFTAFAVSDASGELVALATVSRDVTEERRARLALAESEARLAAELAVMKRLQELSTRLVKHGDGAGLLPEIVDAAIGITAADMGNVQLYDGASDSLRIVASRGFRPEDLELFAVIRRGESTCGTALERGERVVVGDVTASPIFAGKPILDAVLAAGIRALQSTPLISRSGRLVGMLSTHFRSPRSPAERDLRILDLLARQAADWIERTQAEAALRESEARFRNMADHAPVMIWVTDPTGACNYVNERWCDFTGTPPEKSFDFGWLDSVHPDDREKAGSAFRSANARNEAFRVEYRLRRHDGAYRWVIDSAAPRFAPDGAYLGYIGSVLDVTDEKRAEEEIRRARDELDLRVRERTAALSEALAALGRQEEVRKELLRRVVTVQEDERRRISRELHDQMGQQLTALMLRLRLAKDSAGEDSPLQEQLRWLEGHAALISRDVHRVALELRPTALDDLGLPEALAHYADEWTRRSGVAAELRVNGLGEGRLPPLVETTIYRAVQEAMTNVLKHAGATRVVVTLNRLKDSASVIIEDDGRGFDGEGAMESDSRARLGLLGMKERVAFAGGTLAIESSPGAGTSVLIRIPIQSSEEGPR